MIQYESLSEVIEALESISAYLESQAQAQQNPRKLRVNHELDLQAQRLREIQNEEA